MSVYPLSSPNLSLHPRLYQIPHSTILIQPFVFQPPTTLTSNLHLMGKKTRPASLSFSFSASADDDDDEEVEDDEEEHLDDSDVSSCHYHVLGLGQAMVHLEHYSFDD